MSESHKQPEHVPLYAGLSGIDLPVEQFEFGEGVVLRKTTARVMAPYLAAVGPGKHGEPWKAVSGGSEFHVSAELVIPLDFNTTDWFNRLNTIWWFVVLIRAVANPLARVPVIADIPYAEMALSQSEPTIWPLEMSGHGLLVETPSREIGTPALEWIRLHWRDAGRLIGDNKDFHVAFEAFDRALTDRSPSIALLILWGAIERLFSPSHQELTFRVSASLASYLEPAGEARFQLFKAIKKLYDARSKAAHGSGDNDQAAFVETRKLLKRALLKIIESRHVPERSEIEKLMFL